MYCTLLLINYALYFNLYWDNSIGINEAKIFRTKYKSLIVLKSIYIKI